MDYIIKSGVSTKHTIPNTKKAISLAISNKELSGVSLNLNMTKDKKIVIASGNTLENFPNIKIRDYTLEELRKYNIGNRVNREHIMSLEEALEDFHDDPQSFIFTLNDHQENNKEFAEIVSEIINQYPNTNIYIKSPVAEIVLYLRELIKHAKVGAVLLDDSTYFLKQHLDFYSLAGPSLCPYWAKQKQEEGTLLMIENVNSIEEATSTVHEVESFLDKMYMIINNVNTFNTIYPVCQKEIENLEKEI